jgi:integrase
MGRARNPNPSYLRHRQSGKARMIVCDHAGARREIMLPGRFNSKQSLDEYHRVCAMLQANNGRLPATRSGTIDLTVSELVLRYMEEHAAAYYVDPDTKEPTTEIDCLRAAFRPLNRLFGEVSVVEFDSLQLETLQKAMATGDWLTAKEIKERQKSGRPLAAARTTINRHLDRVRRLFRWGCAKKIVPTDNLVNLEAVASLKKGRTAARETEPVMPVDPDVVAKTLPYLPAVPADMVKLLLLSGARVGELCRLRPADMDRSGPVWLYHVPRHKNAYRGIARTIAFGPRCQLILRRHLRDDAPDLPVFSPAESERDRHAERRKQRKTPLYRSHLHRLEKQRKENANASKRPGESFDPDRINHAIRRACEQASILRWHTHQLRHSAALLIMREHGPEAARSVLGHREVNMTLHYSGIDLERAKEVMSMIG